MSRNKLWSDEEIDKLVHLRLSEELTWDEIAPQFDNVTANSARKAYYRYVRDGAKSRGLVVLGPKVLVFDIETAPIEAYVWGLFDQNIGLEMVKQHTTILSWSAKWLGAPESEVMYRDQRHKKNVRDDKEILKSIWSLLDEADIVLTQNGIRFDVKKLNYRFAFHGMKPPSSYKHIDTLRIAKKNFAFDSNKLAHMTEMFCVKYKKLDHGEFAGFKLWKECLLGNPAAYKAMEKYNKYDVLSLEELYVDHLAKWDNTVNFELFNSDTTVRCNCGSVDFTNKGFHYTKRSKFARYVCNHCGKEHRDSKNLFTTEKRKSLKA